MRCVFVMRFSISDALDEEKKMREHIDEVIGGQRSGESIARLFRLLTSPTIRSLIVRLSSLLLESKTPFSFYDDLTMVEVSPDFSQSAEKRQRVKRSDESGTDLGSPLHASIFDCLMNREKLDRVIEKVTLSVSKKLTYFRERCHSPDINGSSRKRPRKTHQQKDNFPPFEAALSIIDHILRTKQQAFQFKPEERLKLLEAFSKDIFGIANSVLDERWKDNDTDCLLSAWDVFGRLFIYNFALESQSGDTSPNVHLVCGSYIEFVYKSLFPKIFLESRDPLSESAFLSNFLQTSLCTTTTILRIGNARFIDKDELRVLLSNIMDVKDLHFDVQRHFFSLYVASFEILPESASQCRNLVINTTIEVMRRSYLFLLVSAVLFCFCSSFVPITLCSALT